MFFCVRTQDSAFLYDHTDTVMLLVNVVCYLENQKQKPFLTGFRMRITAEMGGSLSQNFSEYYFHDFRKFLQQPYMKWATPNSQAQSSASFLRIQD